MNLLFEFFVHRWKTIFFSEVSNETYGKIKNCVQSTKHKLSFEIQLNILRDSAKKDSHTIQVADFGVGSKKMGTNRSIQSIYKNSTSSLKFQRILFNLCQEFERKNCLEMGTSLGFSTVFLAKGASEGKITTIEACPQTAVQAISLFQKMQLQNATLVNLKFLDFLSQEDGIIYDLVFVDGHHDGTALLQYIEILKRKICDNAILVLDDIRWSNSMLTTWRQLKNDRDFPIQLDLFRMGILVYSEKKSEETNRIYL